MKRLLQVFVALALLHGACFAAVPTAATMQPDPAQNSVLSVIQKQGAKFYYLGARSGLDGWFIVKGAQVQIAYATPDNKSAVIGALFGDEGSDITTAQISSLVQNNKEVADLITAAQKEQTALEHVGAPAASATTPAANALPSAPLSPGERLMHDLAGASSVVVGNASSPEILMVMDTRCAHCHATWKLLRDVVAKGGVHLRMIPIATRDSESERAAGVFLGVADPASVWDKFVAGDKAQLDGTPSAAALLAVRSNLSLVTGWKITDTPFLVYRSKDGKVKIVKGEPDDVSSVLHDLGL